MRFETIYEIGDIFNFRDKNYIIFSIKNGKYNITHICMDNNKIDKTWFREVTKDWFDDKKFLTQSKIGIFLQEGDVFEDVYNYVIVKIEGSQYIIRGWYPDEIVHFKVNEDWFYNKKYITTIQLK